ncbi:MAG: erythromycin esterase family protein [Bacteroidetes bacterium]|nr:erythromycin esterase family protein [Fibrella sp.]
MKRRQFKLSILTLIGLSALTAWLTTDYRIQWLRENAVRISVDPYNEDFSDMEPLKAAIGQADMVLLGEQTHGDGTTFEAKCRLVKFLHQQMNFDVLAFESSFYACSKANQLLLNRTIAPKQALQSCLFPIWGMAKEVESLPDYLQRQYDNPLEISGFDCQSSGRLDQGVVDDLTDFLVRKQIDISPGHLHSLRVFFSWHKPQSNPPIDSLNKHQSAVYELVNAINDTTLEGRSWKHYLQSTAYYIAKKVAIKDDPIQLKGNTLRDSLMAENLLWLKREKYPNKKIIVWAASMHNLRGRHKIGEMPKGRAYYPLITMGDILSRRLAPERIYNIGFSAAEGNCAVYNRTDSALLTPPLKNSFEAAAIEAGLENAFVDFRSKKKPFPSWQTKPFFMRVLGVNHYRAPWFEHLDGVCFTRHMQRVHPSR